MSLCLIEVQSSGYLYLASLCVKVVLLIEEAGNYCSENSWKEVSWSVLAAGDIFLPRTIQVCVRASVVDRSQ